jgi:phosphoribosylformimino-5-aminoimidazole carboxamide ribonucleotide (ProFAR) isomerase
MPFTVLPAIDVTDGHLGVYTPEGPRAIEAFDGDPVVAAGAFAAAGARWVHLVDMDLAFHGHLANTSVVRAVRRAVPELRIQASGGLRRWEDVERTLEAGAARVVIGSAALADAAATETLLARANGRALAGIEVSDGRIRARGRDDVDLDLMSTLGWLAATGRLPGLLVTAVPRVGALSGPDVDLVRRIARRGVPTLVAGGVRSLEDLSAVRAAGAQGAVVGRAALEGALDLTAALTWAAA